MTAPHIKQYRAFVPGNRPVPEVARILWQRLLKKRRTLSLSLTQSPTRQGYNMVLSCEHPIFSAYLLNHPLIVGLVQDIDKATDSSAPTMCKSA